MVASKIEVISAETIATLRQRASAISQPDRRCPAGWSISSVDPAGVLAVFEPLRLKPGFTLRAYQFTSGGNGNGFVWAIPEGSELPHPDRCPRLEDRFLSPPKPPSALDDLMEAVDGDGSAFSYLCTSIAARELAEFGAMWHGVSWGAVRVLGSDPRADRNDSADSSDVPSKDGWSWLSPEPAGWEPTVEMGEESVLVSFLTYTALGEVKISRVSDRFAVGSYVFSSGTEVLASGGSGYIP